MAIKHGLNILRFPFDLLKKAYFLLESARVSALTIGVFCLSTEQAYCYRLRHDNASFSMLPHGMPQTSPGRTSLDRENVVPSLPFVSLLILPARKLISVWGWGGGLDIGQRPLTLIGLCNAIK